ncbi:SERTA domain-containing protein 1 [Platysternon megacephalum]|uniref:SERTA domain-containing protein 1 n=1 Tax=Platysternon megacephalum TaxID=55544 RepID=A0A4D9DLK8_9SAUR|nr:SERTA domain-containing protein 1 [Platysternon megacephalum]
MGPALWIPEGPVVQHSWDILFTGVQGSKGIPNFFVLGQVDGLGVAYYDSTTPELSPTRDWMRRAVEPGYFRGKTQELLGYKEGFQCIMGRLLERYNQTVVPPEVSVSCRDAPDGSVTLSCHARGFYPRPIHVSWVRDKEDILAETDSSGILPNADSTYYTQSSLEISLQQDRHRFACRVEHTSLLEPTVVWVPGKKGPLPPGVLVLLVLTMLAGAGAAVAGVIMWRRKRLGPVRPRYTPTALAAEDACPSAAS